MKRCLSSRIKMDNYTWSDSSQYIVLNDTETVITAQWREDLLPTYGPIDGIPKADGGMLYMGGIQWQVIGRDSSRALLISADQLGGMMRSPSRGQGDHLTVMACRPTAMPPATCIFPRCTEE